MPDKLKFNILIVDDERSELAVLNHILEQDYNISIAKSGQVALKMAIKDKPDLILLDVIMPDMSGFEVLSELKKHDATQSIPVIFITGLDRAQDEAKGFSLGAVDYITKPFHHSIVRARVMIHLQIVKQIRTIQSKDAALGVLESVLNGMDTYIYVTDIKTDGILFVNKKLMEHFELTDAVIDKPCWKVFQSGFAKRCSFCSLNNLSGDSNEPFIWEAYNSITGRYYRNIDRIIDWPGGKKVLFCQRIDMTESKQALVRAERANRAKSEFLSHMSHEMRTPMNVVIGMTGIAKDSAELTKKNDCLDKIDSASKHLLGVINDILDMTQIESGELKLYYDELVFEKVFLKAVDTVRFHADEKKHIITTNIHRDIPPVIMGDERRLNQIITNLLLNSVKFTPEGGNIALDAELASESGDAYTILIKVVDNGIGISKETQSHLFRAFEQADGGVARKYGGSGLGLALCKHFVELMGGSIWVESEPECGSTFYFTIVADKADARADNLSSEKTESFINQSLQFSGKTVLLAEDVELNRMMVEEQLSDTGLIIECAKNGQEAFDIIMADPEKYSLILMDINMPEMDGYTATRLIRGIQTPAAANVPIIAMTANVYKEDIEKCFEVGMNDHIGKPVDMNVLIQKINKYIGG